MGTKANVSARAGGAKLDNIRKSSKRYLKNQKKNNPEAFQKVKEAFDKKIAEWRKRNKYKIIIKAL